MKNYKSKQEKIETINISIHKINESIKKVEEEIVNLNNLSDKLKENIKNRKKQLNKMVEINLLENKEQKDKKKELIRKNIQDEAKIIKINLEIAKGNKLNDKLNNYKNLVIQGINKEQIKIEKNIKTTQDQFDRSDRRINSKINELGMTELRIEQDKQDAITKKRQGVLTKDELHYKYVMLITLIAINAVLGLYIVYLIHD